MNPLLNKLRYHVTGAIERGEGEAIVEKRAPQHTPTPWKVHPTVNQHRYNAAIDFGPSGIAVGVVWGPFEQRTMDAETEANAAFIVRACNSHEALVKAALNMLRVERSQGISDEDFEAAVEQLDAALAQAGEER